MRVGVGYSDNPDTMLAGVAAAGEALRMSGRTDPCDVVMLFSTAKHDADILLKAVSGVVGANVRIVGGGAVGTITNGNFGYAGDQVGIACMWLDGVNVEIVAEGDLNLGEYENGRRLGRKLLDKGAGPPTQIMLFYDAIDRSQGDMRMMMATYLLGGMENEMGFLPDLNGAGMMGDYACSPMRQWVGNKITENHSVAMLFDGQIRIDSVIMHGCRPATRYYTVTKASGQVILEINGQPALEFVHKLLGGSISPENFPFFLIFGVNKAKDKWGEFNDDDYASRLCLAIDSEHSGIVMFEPDMVEGTEFQIMYRSLELDYMKPKIEGLFDGLNGRTPVFAFYINCAGRAAGYGGMDIEDAVVLQKTVADRVPLLGIYSGVEIAKILGRPRGLDWTGVLCMFSVPK
jgi:hypothetical protein